jgi:Ca-activated chloride channel homolog
MSFSSPWWLFLLLLVPLVIALHALSIRWRSTPISSLLFWNEVLRERKASLRIRRLLTSLVLLLQILAMAALAIAIGGPLVAGRGGAGSQDVILVLDASASMQAREGDRTRFDIAREHGLDLAAGLRGGARMSVVLAEKSPRVLFPFTTDKSALRRALQAAAATDEPGDVAASMLFAMSLRDPRRGGQVVLETDGAFDELPGVDTTLPWVRVEEVGSSQENVGITQMSFRLASGAGAGYQLFLAVRNAGRSAAVVPLTVSAGGRRVLDRTITVAAGQRSTLTVPWSGPTAGRVEAALQARDALAVDDRAYAVFAPARRVQVRVIGAQPYFIQQALASLPGVTVTTQEAPDAAGAAGAAGRDDVVVYAGVQPPPLDRGNFILFEAVPPNLPIRVTGGLRVPPVTGWSRTDPLLDSVSLAGITIGQALDLDPGPGFSILAASGTSPLLLSWDHSGVKALLLAFDPRASDFPLRPGFPVLLANALSWFYPTWLQAQADQVQAGDPRLLPAEGAETVDVVKPDGQRETLAAGGPSAAFFDTDETGFYRVEAAGTTREFAVNLSSDAETDITPRFAAPSAGPESAGRASVPSPIWPVAAAAALALLLLEWLVWVWRPGRSLTA